MVLDRLFRAGEKSLVKRLARMAEDVDDLEPEVKRLSDADLRGETDKLRAQHADGKSLGDLLPRAFAVVREAATRTLGQRPFKVQVMGGGALHLGNVAEMKTGEGKTLTCTMPAYLNAISGHGVHVVTTNDYLAKRDAETMGRIHRFLGLNVGVILSDMKPARRRQAYAADITYGTNNEFGFDYLRDNMCWMTADMVQRGHNFAIVDEADSILIDEARTPLIISGPAEKSARWYTEFARLAPLMKREVHYEVDERKRTIGVSEEGVAFIEDQLGIDNLYESVISELVAFLHNSLKAKELYKRDKDYIVRGGEVLIVDEFTGRVLAGRRYNEGMHQAIEAKENVEIKAENQTLATVTLQNYFRLYTKLSGMTGTAQTEAAELDQIYKMSVVTIPTNRPMIREDHRDLIYKTEEAKFSAVADDIAGRYERGQPVLVGTTSVEKSEYLAKLLLARGVPHEVLNAKHHEREAVIVAKAGHAGAVTVSTNMAGRGTDIMLGGNPDFMADQELRARGLDPVETPEDYEAAWDRVLAAAREQVAAEYEEVRQAGGLYVLGTERHEARRIDNQLRGRSGRQGDPGQSRFYLSLGDELMRRFNGQAVETIMNRLNVPDDVPIEAGMVTKAIRSAQTQVEQQNFEIRKNVLKYDEVMNKQRVLIYEERRRVLAGENLAEQVQNMLEDVLRAYVDGATADGYAEDWDLGALWTALGTLYPVSIRWQDVVEGEDLDTGEPLEPTPELLLEAIHADAKAAYARREQEIDVAIAAQGGMRELERQILLTVLDRKWREHLYEMDYLKEGIGLRAMAQRDPLIEYQREGYNMFTAMMDGIKEEAVGYLFNVQVAAAEETAQPEARAAAPAAVTAPPAADPAGGPGVTGAAGGEHPGGEHRGSEHRGRHAALGSGGEAPAAVPVAFGGTRVGPSEAQLQYSGPAEDGGETRRSGNGRRASNAGAAAEPSRNRPCPCGSGRKYKHCHGARSTSRR